MELIGFDVQEADFEEAKSNRRKSDKSDSEER